MNRIHHIVVPPTVPLPNDPRLDTDDSANSNDQHGTVPAVLHRGLKSVRQRLLPIDVSRTRTRLVILAPSLIHSARSLLLLLVSMAQAAAYPNSPVPDSSIFAKAYQPLSIWALTLDSYDICWMVYQSMCFMVLSGAILSGLEGRCVSLPNAHVWSRSSADGGNSHLQNSRHFHVQLGTPECHHQNHASFR